MRKINETYLHEETGISFEVEYEKNIELRDENPVNKRVKILPSGVGVIGLNKQSFVFSRSKPEMVIKIGQALLDIGKFCNTL